MSAGHTFSPLISYDQFQTQLGISWVFLVAKIKYLSWVEPWPSQLLENEKKKLGLKTKPCGTLEIKDSSNENSKLKNTYYATKIETRTYLWFLAFNCDS